MSLGDKLFVAASVFGIGAMIAKEKKETAIQEEKLAIEEEKRRKAAEKEKKRRDTKFSLPTGLDDDAFEMIAKRAAKKTKRVFDVKCDAPLIVATAISQSGKSDWDFALDFNDYGELTGKYWVTSDNHSSTIPDYYANAINEEIKLFFKDKDKYISRYEQSQADIERHVDELLEQERIDAERKRIEREDEIFQHEEEIRKRREQIEQQRLDEKLARIEQRKKRKDFFFRHWKALLITFVIINSLIIGGLIYLDYYTEKQKQIKYEASLRTLKYSSSELVGKNYNDVHDELVNEGFEYVYTSSEDDLDYKDINQNELVYKITIDERTTFEAGERYPYDTLITVYYHSPMYVDLPISSEETKGENYKTIKSKLEEAGFGNIKLTPIYDVVIGLINKDGDIDLITIDGDSEFDTSSKYKVDSKIEIKYHTYKKNK